MIIWYWVLWFRPGRHNKRDQKQGQNPSLCTSQASPLCATPPAQDHGTAWVIKKYLRKSGICSNAKHSFYIWQVTVNGLKVFASWGIQAVVTLDSHWEQCSLNSGCSRARCRWYRQTCVWGWRVTLTNLTGQIVYEKSSGLHDAWTELSLKQTKIFNHSNQISVIN